MSRDQAVTNHSEKETSQLVLPRESESQASSGGNSLLQGRQEGDDAGAPRPQPDQVWCKVVKGGALPAYHPQILCPGCPGRKGTDTVPLAPRERESFPPPPLQQETPPLSLPGMVITGPSSQCSQQAERRSSTSRGLGPCPDVAHPGNHGTPICPPCPCTRGFGCGSTGRCPEHTSAFRQRPVGSGPLGWGGSTVGGPAQRRGQMASLASLALLL